MLAIVITPSLFLILAFGMHDDLGKHLGQDIGELEAGPGVILFQNIQYLTCSVSLSSAEEQDAMLIERELIIELVASAKVSIVEGLHEDLLLVTRGT